MGACEHHGRGVTVVMGAQLFFVAIGDLDRSPTLWATDGTTAETAPKPTAPAVPRVEDFPEKTLLVLGGICFGLLLLGKLGSCLGCSSSVNRILFFAKYSHYCAPPKGFWGGC